MLRQLHIENYTLIENLDIEFHPGLNVLTGETGSGKSIVVEAVGLLLGGKTSAELIRSGSERARISGEFSGVSSTKASHSSKPESGSEEWRRLTELLAEGGIELPEGEDLILQRDIMAGGKSRAFVNHQPATALLLKNIALYLAEVHGQNEQQELFSPAEQLQMLDRFGGLTALASMVREGFQLWKSLRGQQQSLALRQQDRLRQMDMWRFQAAEIEQAAVAHGEDQRLEEEKLLLVHAERIHANLASSYDLLYDSSGSAGAALASAIRKLEEVSSFDAELKPLCEALQSARVSVEDIALSLRDRLSRLETTPGRLEEVENRLALLDRLKRKYGPSLEEVVRFAEKTSAELREMESSEALNASLENKVAEAAAAFSKYAGQLSARRAAAAGELKLVVEKELRALAMAGTVFEARLASIAETGGPEQWSASGIDRVEFLISPNPGEPLRPLARIASGGEISRIMLALEIVTDATVANARGSAGRRDHTLVFDEVDAGIGGYAAETVGKKLRQLGDRRQVLCVTHLPQIASFAHHHFRVEKSARNGRTAARVQYLQKSERAEELARMLSGSQITAAVLKHAEQLLNANS